MLYLLKTNEGTFTLRVMESLLHCALLLVIPQVIALWFWEDVNTEAKEDSIPSLSDDSSAKQLKFDATTVSDGADENSIEIQPIKSSNSERAPDSEDQSSESAKTQHEQNHGSSTTMTGSQQVEQMTRQASDHFANLPDRKFLGMGPRAVPWIVLASHVVQFAGAGMTVKFFPLFFKTEYGIQPIQGCILASIYTLFITAFTIAIQRFAKRIGRAQASIIFTTLGIVALLVLSNSYSFKTVVVMYILRGALQNASAPLDRSMQMDYVPQAHRGKFMALESLLTVAWAFSALFGGFIADMHNYRTTFRITAVVFIFSTLMYAPLLWLVPRDESFAKAKKKVT